MTSIPQQSLCSLLIASALISTGCVPLGVGAGNLRSSVPEGRWVVPADADKAFALVEQPRSTERYEDEIASKRFGLAADAQAIPVRYAAKVLPTPKVTGLEMQQAAELPIWAEQRPPLSPGDRLQIEISDGEEFSGLYELDTDGSLNLPYLPALQVAGNSQAWAQERIAEALVNAGYFRPGLIRVSVKLQQWAPVQVNVSGAVFNPGLVTVNVRKPEEKAQKSLQASGDYSPERMLSAALRAAGGIRPDADLARVILVRSGNLLNVDLTGVIHGLPAPAIAIMAGDAIIVPSTGRFDEALVKPSAVTPPGIRVFLSNLTTPATDNSRSAINKDATSLPYGTRLLTGLISANCVGGTASTNSARYGVLVTHNPLSNESEIIERPIEQLLREPEREDLNPQLMPNDGVACYDSGITNLRDIARTLADILLPVGLLR